MVEPEFKCVLYGTAYHDNKVKLKKILKKHNMEYSGSFVFPYWGGESEYVRGEFKKEYNEETGKDETKEANLSLYLRKDAAPTDFSREFIEWCEQSGGKQTSVGNTDLEVQEDFQNDDYSTRELKKVIGYNFRRGRKEAGEDEVVYAMSFDKGWTSPKKARAIVQTAIKKGLLKKKDGKLVPTFDTDTIEYGAFYQPDIVVIETEDD